jgi:hypothetical protein
MGKGIIPVFLEIVSTELHSNKYLINISSMTHERISGSVHGLVLEGNLGVLLMLQGCPFPHTPKASSVCGQVLTKQSNKDSFSLYIGICLSYNKGIVKVTDVKGFG